MTDKTHLVFRVENDDGDGPYMTDTLGRGGFVCTYSDNHPSPPMDMMFNGDLFYAFDSLELLFQWFGRVEKDGFDSLSEHCDPRAHEYSDALEWLGSCGYNVWVYAVDDEHYTACPSGLQCGFERDHADIIKTMTFTEARSKMQ